MSKFSERCAAELAAEERRVAAMLAQCADTKTPPGNNYWYRLHRLRERARMAAEIEEILEDV